MPSQEATSTFVSFSAREELLAKLRSIEDSGTELEPLYRLMADRLALKAYDSSAFVFILIELIYEFTEIYEGPLGDLLTRSVLALTGDGELAQAALQAYREIQATLEPSLSERSEDDESIASEEEDEGREETSEAIDDGFLRDALPIPAAEPVGPLVPRPRSTDQERLRIGLQEAQKQVADLGLSTRMAIDMSLHPSGRENVSHTLREIAALRALLRKFDALLGEAEERILEEIGILEKD